MKRRWKTIILINSFVAILYLIQYYTKEERSERISIPLEDAKLLLKLGYLKGGDRYGLKPLTPDQFDSIMLIYTKNLKR